ncbi:hypothetical protein DL93DRAFT_2079667 [Clavulina sp. PMI_390]|nr:hypothetical protein DL93DRAFT_2079667 [Clavulina sp. PMI_390]
MEGAKGPRNGQRPQFMSTENSSTIGKLSRASFTPVYPDSIYVWGSREQSHDFAVFNWKTREWRFRESNPRTDAAPGIRHAHTATHYSHEGRSMIALYGGYDDRMHAPTTVHLYDVEEGSWVFSTSQDASHGETPMPRSFHTTTFVKVDNEPYLFVVGGLHMRTDPNSRDRNWTPPELCVFNLRLRKWYPSINVMARYGHAAVLLPGTHPRILILGGRDARGKHTPIHYVINVLAILDHIKVNDDPLVSMLGSLSLSDEQQPSAHGAPWRTLPAFSDDIGPFNGTSNLWAERVGNIIYILGQGTVDTRVPVDLFPGATNPALPYSLSALKFDAGWMALDDITTHVLPVAEIVEADYELSERWLWFGVLDSGVKCAHGESVESVDWGGVSSEHVLFALNATHKSQPSRATEDDPRHSIRSLGVPIRCLPGSDARLGTLREDLELVDPHPALFSRYVPEMSRGATNSPPSTELQPFQPDFAITTLSHDLSPILAHSLVLGSRSSYFNMMLTGGFSTRSNASGSIRFTASLEEEYRVAYALIYYLYCDTLPPYLLAPNHSLEPPSSSIPAAESRNLFQDAHTAADVLIAADKYLLPSRLSSLVRRTIMDNFIHLSPTIALYCWRAAYLTRNSQFDRAGNVLLTMSALPPSSGTSSRSDTLVTINREDETWLEQALREAYEHQLRNTPDPPAAAFFAEVSRWCTRRIHEIEEVLPQDISTATSAHQSADTLTDDGDRDTSEQEHSENFELEDEVMDAFWEEMARLGAVP